MELAKEVAEYYHAIAPQYHKRLGYDKEDYAAASGAFRDLLSTMFSGRDVLELACGTGYWTRIAAKTAKSVLATDLNHSMITQAEKLSSEDDNIEFKVADAFSPENIPGQFSGAFSVLWWCHIPKQGIKNFLSALHNKLKPGSNILFICQLEDLDAENHELDSDGNIIAIRKADSRVYRIVKNVPSEKDIRELLSPVARDIQYSRYSDYGLWSVSYSI